MNWLDWAVVAVLAGFALWGLIKGLVKESLGFLGLLLAAGASLAVNPWATGVLQRLGRLSRPSATLAAALLAFVLFEFLWLVALFFLLRRPRRQSFRRSAANRLGGGLFALGKGVLLVSLGLLLLEAAPMPQGYRRAAEKAALAARARAVAPWCAGQVAAILPGAARRRYEAFRAQVAQLEVPRWRTIAPTTAEPLPHAAPGGRYGVTPAPPPSPTPAKSSHESASKPGSGAPAAPASPPRKGSDR
jgi:uncharacterized membrane protein required for colicin V production